MKIKKNIQYISLSAIMLLTFHTVQAQPEKKAPEKNLQNEQVQPDARQANQTGVQKKSDTEEKTSSTQSDSKQDEGIINLIIRGGWTMLGLGIISTIIIAFSIERFLYFKRQNLNTRGFNDLLAQLLETGNIENAASQLEKQDSLIGKIIHYGLCHHKMGVEEIERSLEKRTNIEIGKLERGLNLLANFGNLAPLLGFFGTVVGMRASFLQFVIQKAPTAQDLAGGVEEALITTAAGLLVAIPTYLVYNLFIYQIDHFGTEIEEASSVIHDHLKKGPVPKPKTKKVASKKEK